MKQAEGSCFLLLASFLFSHMCIPSPPQPYRVNNQPTDQPTALLAHQDRVPRRPCQLASCVMGRTHAIVLLFNLCANRRQQRQQSAELSRVGRESQCSAAEHLQPLARFLVHGLFPAHFSTPAQSPGLARNFHDCRIDPTTAPEVQQSSSPEAASKLKQNGESSVKVW